jgi:hypothetical protein
VGKGGVADSEGNVKRNMRFRGLGIRGVCFVQSN